MAARTRLMVTFPAHLADVADAAGSAAAGGRTSRVSPLGFPFRLLLVLCILPLLLVASVAVTYREQQADVIYNGVNVLGLEVGRMTPSQAAQATSLHLQALSRRPFYLRYDQDAIQVTLATLGLRIDDEQINQVAQRAWSVGRETEWRLWLREQLALLRYGYAVPVALNFDRDRAVAVLGRVAADVEQPTVNAELSVERAGERFEIHTTPARTGRRLNVNGTLDALAQALASSVPDSLDLVLVEAPPAIADADLVPATEAIQAILASPLVFKDGARSWTLEPGAAYEMLQISGFAEGRPPITAGLDESKLRAFIERTARDADQPATNPSLAIEGSQVVVKPGSSGKLVDVQATLELAMSKATSPEHSLDIVFTEDKPWLSAADLEPFRSQANALLNLPITLETPALPGIQEQKWLLDRNQLAQLLVLPNTQTTPRDYATLPASVRPRFDIQLDSGKVTAFLAREVAPWVSEDAADATLQTVTSTAQVPNPAYNAALDAQRQAAENAARAQAAEPSRGSNGRATATPRPTPAPAPITVPPMLSETRYRVEIRSNKIGRVPDYLGTFSSMQLLFRSSQPADPAERRVTVRTAPNPPRVQDQHLVAARDLANTLIGEPVQVRWKDRTWTVTRDQLANMLRYQTDSGGITAYLSRDGLVAIAQTIAQEAERLGDRPLDLEQRPLPVDVAGTAAAIWQQASTSPTDRVAELVWNEDVIRQQMNAAAMAGATATAQAVLAGEGAATAPAPR